MEKQKKIDIIISILVILLILFSILIPLNELQKILINLCIVLLYFLYNYLTNQNDKFYSFLLLFLLVVVRIIFYLL